MWPHLLLLRCYCKVDSYRNCNFDDEFFLNWNERTDHICIEWSCTRCMYVSTILCTNGVFSLSWNIKIDQRIWLSRFLIRHYIRKCFLLMVIMLEYLLWIVFSFPRIKRTIMFFQCTMMRTYFASLDSFEYFHTTESMILFDRCEYDINGKEWTLQGAKAS